MQIDGITYLLSQEENGSQGVQPYSQADMEEEFTVEQRAELAAGRVVVKQYRFSLIRFLDMGVAAVAAMKADA